MEDTQRVAIEKVTILSYTDSYSFQNSCADTFQQNLQIKCLQ